MPGLPAGVSEILVAVHVQHPGLQWLSLADMRREVVEVLPELRVAAADAPTSTRLLGRTQLSSATYSDPQQLADALLHSREELRRQGFDLAPWSMPE